ncbi:Linearmycin resistance ATP-binding protein LnrL [Paenibacillus sp. CECT 9249]|uniref:ABC transporter ATP-binding protein n=1 Tax=Paenibacillus sp. CECT 9249 TaxID=2845385 RepID=UPI001E461CBA|nr:ATP-binding cassette domain-containing protein [Paenibacillus sp. CECT 9249]CAH0118894.1 Linearmycin resistance ATP-binding protein LnrL [Paenibacillus sp. CECT 9249]
MVLAVEHLYKRYGDKLAVNNLYLKVESGKTLGLIGNSGAGKTTIIRSILGLIDYDKGYISWNNRQIGNNRPKVGYLPEEKCMYPNAKVQDLLIYLGRLEGMSKFDAKQSAKRWLERLRIPEHFDKELHRLSRCNQEKVKIASALIHNPDLIVFDEPFGELYSDDAGLLASILKELAYEGKMIVFSSRLLRRVESFCEEVCVIRQGEKVVSGNLQTLKHSVLDEMETCRIHADEAGAVT